VTQAKQSPVNPGRFNLALAIREGCALASLDPSLNETAAAEGVLPFA